MIGILILIFLIIVVIFISYKRIEVNSYDIEDEKIDKDLKIILLSDLHNRNIKDKLEDIIEIEKPDIIILSGDMINDYPKESKNFINLFKIFDKYKTYYTFGNHEEEILVSNKIKYIEKISKSNIILLNNMKSDLTFNINLFGLNLDYDFYKRPKKKKIDFKYINDKLGSLDKNKFNVLIAHNPLDAPIYQEYGFDLVLSGHIHGGIIKLPKLGGVFSPDYTFFPKYYNGMYVLNKMKLIVSRGLGFSKRLPFRMFNPAEVVVINLMKKK